LVSRLVLFVHWNLELGQLLLVQQGTRLAVVRLKIDR
jgi:hypothetical protein